MVKVNVVAANAEDLVRAAVAGESSAQQELIQRHSAVVWATVRRFGLREADAQDAVQNTWVSMIEHLGSLREANRLAGWLVTTARRECLKIARQSRRHPVAPQPVLSEVVDERSPAPERTAVDAQMKQLLWSHVAQLPPQGRDMLTTLVASDEARYAEFAAATGLPVGSIGPMRMRYLNRLRKALESAGLGAQAWR